MLPQGSKPRPSLFISASWCSYKYGTEGGKDWQGYRWIYRSSMEESGDYWQSDHVGLDRSDSSKMQVMPPCCVSRQNQMIQNGDHGKWQYLWPWTGGVWSYFGFQVLYLCATVLCKYSLSATCQLIVERPPSTSATASFHNVHFIMFLLFIYQFAGPTLITRNLWQFTYLCTPKLLFRSAILGLDVLNMISKYSTCCYSNLRGS